MKKVGADWPTSARPIVAWSRSEFRRTADRTPIGNATTSATTKATSPSSNVARRYDRATSIAGWRKWIERPKSPRSTFARKTPYWTGRDRSRPRSRRTRSISEIGASGGSSRGTGSPDSRITTKTTVETSQRATRVLKSR